MGAIDGPSQLLAVLEESICRDSAVEFAVVFGSQVTGSTRPSSDVDVAVKFSDELSSHERFQKRCFLSGDLQHENAPFVDISDIEELPLAVAHDAVGGDLLCGDERTFREFKQEIESGFEEQQADIRRRQRDVIDRIAEEGFRG